MHKKIIGLVIGLFAGVVVLSSCNQVNVTTVSDCKVIELQQQQLIQSSGGNTTTEIRYLVVTDKETFVCESSLLNGKFNNSDIFFHLKEDSTYTFKVAGVGKTMVSEYRNILEIVK